MPFDLSGLLQEHGGDNFALHRAHLNHQMVRVLQMTGFDRHYERAEGSWLWDTDGQEYLDFLSGFGVFALGRNHPALKAALQQALDLDLPNLVQLDCPPLAGVLAERLCGLAGAGLDRCFFTNSGTEAVESAIKFARRATGRSRILHCDHAFHGLTTGSLALNGGAEFRAGFEPLLPHTTAITFGDPSALEWELSRGDVAAHVLEPIQGKNVHVATADYLATARDLCHRFGALLIVDEVQSGLGRTGAMFCYQHSDVVPDIVTIAKALSGGYVPVGAVLCRDDVWRSVYRTVDEAMVHSSTFGQNTLAMVAGLATLSVFDDEQTVRNAEATGRRLQAGLRDLQADHDVIADVRGRGLMVGIEFGEPRGLRGRSAWRMVEAIRNGLFAQLVVEPLFNDHHIITQVAADHVNIVKLLPPLVAGDKEVDHFLSAFDEVLRKVRHLGVSMARLGKDFTVRSLRTGALRK